MHAVLRRVVMAAAVAAAITSSACRERGAPAARAGATMTRAPGYVVDSALPSEETLRRFRAGLEPVEMLDRAASTSRERLTTSFANALARRDTATLRAMSISRAEFAYLYYPSTQYVRPPYLTAPDVLWKLMQARSETGLGRLAARVGGAEIRIISADCEPTPVAEGDNRFYRECRIRYQRAAGAPIEQRRLFGSVMVRGGRYKFVSYANDF